MTATCSSKQAGMVRRLRFYPLLLSSLACALTPGLTEAGAYIFAGDMWGYDLILHPADYNGSGGTLTVKVCITPGSPHAAAMEIPVQNNINIYNALQPTTNNIFLNSNNNIPSGSLDFESVALHEIGHCLGMAHVNAASESGLTGSDQDYTKSTDGGDGFDLGIGTDNIKGSRDDDRGNDVNLHWFHKASNNPFTIGTTVDSTTYSRNVGDLPGPDSYATNGSRAVSSSLGAPNTEVVMQQGTFIDEAQRTLTHDDIATLRLAASGMDESAGNGDDYTINMEYGGISADLTCDINIAFDNAQTSLAQCNVSGGSIMSTDHWRVVSADIYFNDFNYTWHFNTTTVNQAPVLATIGNQNVVEGQSLPVAVSATDPDGDNLAFSATGLPAFASLVDHGNGTATLNINPATGDAGTYNVAVDVDDDGLPVLTDTEPFQIVVTAPSVDTDGDGVDDATELAQRHRPEPGRQRW